MSPKLVFFGRNPVCQAKIDEDQFFGQNPVFLAKIDQNHIVRAENRKMKTAKLRPKRDKQPPFSSVLIPSPGRDGIGGRGGRSPRDRIGVGIRGRDGG